MFFIYQDVRNFEFDFEILSKEKRSFSGCHFYFLHLFRSVLTIRYLRLLFEVIEWFEYVKISVIKNLINVYGLKSSFVKVYECSITNLPW